MSRVQTLYELQMIGTAVFAVTGVLAVNRRGLDALGGTVLGTVTSLGGGTIRDVVVRAPVFWLVDTNYLLVAVVASLVAFFTSRLVKTTYTLLLYLDALGAAMFAIQATDKVLALQFAPAIAVAMGVLTASAVVSCATPIPPGLPALRLAASRNSHLPALRSLPSRLPLFSASAPLSSTGTSRCQRGSRTRRSALTRRAPALQTWSASFESCNRPARLRWVISLFAGNSAPRVAQPMLSVEC